MATKSTKMGHLIESIKTLVFVTIIVAILGQPDFGMVKDFHQGAS